MFILKKKSNFVANYQLKIKIMTPFPPTHHYKMSASGRKMRALTSKQKAWMREWWPQTSNRELEKITHINHVLLDRFAKELGLHKSPEYMAAFYRRAAEHMNRKNRENGYNDSMRGKRPSQACLDGYAKYAKKMHDGEIPSTHARMKARDPEGYARMVATIGRKNRDLCKREKRRIELGLPKQTRLHLPVNPYTKRQHNQRYYALRLGYFVMEDISDEGGERWNIYYDADTRRSAQFERNLVDGGFRVKEWVEKEYKLTGCLR